VLIQALAARAESSSIGSTVIIQAVKAGLCVIASASVAGAGIGRHLASTILWKLIFKPEDTKRRRCTGGLKEPKGAKGKKGKI